MPLPVLRDLAGEFYGWCATGELRFQRCTACSAWRHVPRELCPDCGSWEWEWARSAGRGTLFSWTLVERPMHPAFADNVPYAAAVVEMEEGVRIVTRIDAPADDLAVGMALEVTFEKVAGDVTLPRFRRA
jgi:uncharacterized OB-fold protein